MRFFIETVTGRKGYKSFKSLDEYVDFMTYKGHLVKTLKEADLPYSDKPVKLPKVSKSKGWEEITDFGDIDREAEKAQSVIASSNGSVMKDEANMEVSKSSEKADKPEMGLGAEKGDVEMANFKEFKYEEPEMKSSESKSPKSDAPKAEEPKEESSKEDDDKEEKKEKVNEEFVGERKISISFEFEKDPELVKKLMGRGDVEKGYNSNYEYNSPLLKGTPKAIQFIIDKLNQLASKNIADYKCSMELVIDGKRNRIGSWTENLDQIKSLLMRKEVTKNEINRSINFDSEIGECLKNAGVQLDEFFKFERKNKDDDSDDKTYKKYMKKEISDDEARSELKKQGIKGKKAKNLVKNAKAKRDSKVEESFKDYLPRDGFTRDDDVLPPTGLYSKWLDKICSIEGISHDVAREKYGLYTIKQWRELFDNKLDESIKDYLPRAGFIRDDDEDKSSQKIGLWFGQGSDEQIAKAFIIAKVRLAHGDRMGLLTKKDLDNFDEYEEEYNRNKEEYDRIYDDFVSNLLK